MYQVGILENLRRLESRREGDLGYRRASNIGVGCGEGKEREERNGDGCDRLHGENPYRRERSIMEQLQLNAIGAEEKKLSSGSRSCDNS